MTSGREGAERILAAAPESVGTIPSSLPGLTCVGPTTNAPFVLDGRHLSVRGSQKDPGASVDFRGIVTASVTTDQGSAANLLQFPGVARREFIGPGGLGHETILAAATHSFAVFQWSDGVATPDVIDVTIRCVDPIASNSLTARSEPRTDLSPASSRRATAVHLGPDLWVGISVTPGPKSLTLDDAAGDDAAEYDETREGSVHSVVRIRPAAGVPVSLVIAMGTASEVCSAFGAAAHAPGHAVRSASGPTDGLYLDTGVAELDDGVAWLRARLAGLVNREDSSVPPQAETDRLMLGLAALAVGDRACSDHLGGLVDAGTPSTAILAAQAAAVFGETGRATAEAERLLSSPAESDGAMLSVAARMLADGLRYAAAEPTISALRERATRPAASHSISGHPPSGHPPASDPASGHRAERRLPVVGARDPRPSIADWLTGLLNGTPLDPTGGASPLEPSVRETLLASGQESHDIDAVRLVAARFPTDPDAAWATWRRMVGAGLVGGPDGPATWERRHAADAEDRGGKDGGSIAAELLLALTHGLLGIAPDAPVGRLHLRPRLPSHLTRFTVGGIPLGDATIRMDFERIGSRLKFALEPERAAVPPLVVFEPTVHGRISEVRVDGALADLSHTTRAGLTTLSLQLPLDGPRVLEIDLERR